MRNSFEYLTLPEGRFQVEVTRYSEEDDVALRQIYSDWINLSSRLRNLGGRGINLPEALSEISFCRAMHSLDRDTVRVTGSIPGANSSFDTYDLTNRRRIQVKACSVLPDLTSFGPDSQWDEIYFVDFYKLGRWNREIDIYLIPNDLIYNHRVNANQTLREQQQQGRRPRFSIYTAIIQNRGVKPVLTYQI